MIKCPVGAGADFSQISFKEYKEISPQKSLETSIRIGNLDGVKFVLNSGAIAEPRFLEEVIVCWKENNAKLDPYIKNGLFTNQLFLPLVDLLKDSIPGMSLKTLKILHLAFSCAFLVGEYIEVIKFKKDVFANRDHITKRRVLFTESEFLMIANLFPVIRRIFKEKSYRSWKEAPKFTSEIFVTSLKFDFKSYKSEITLSNGDHRKVLLERKKLISLIKAIPHDKIRHLHSSEELKPEEYYLHYNTFDSLKISPQFSKKTLQEVFNLHVQVETNEKYFELLREGILNEDEMTRQMHRFKRQTSLCVQKVLDQIKDLKMSDSFSLETVEIRLIRAYWCLYLKGLFVDHSIERHELANDVLKEINEYKKFDDQKTLEEYLQMRVDDEDVSFHECPIPSQFQGLLVKTPDFSQALTSFLS